MCVYVRERERERMKETIVLYPAPSVVQVVSMVELGKLILHHHHLHHFSVTVLIPTTSLDTAAITSYISRFSNTQITFHYLPPLSLDTSPTLNRVAFAFELVRLNNINVINVLQSISQTSTVRSLVTTVPSAIHVASQLNIPSYYYFSSCAATLAAILYLPTIHNQTSESFKDLTNTLLHLPGLPPIRASHMPEPLLDRENQVYHQFLSFATHLPKSKGIVVNTFNSLEPRPIKAIADGLCVPDTLMPPFYYIGPMITGGDRMDEGEDVGGGAAECMTWLNAQPNRSVVFLCFGSRGRFSATQLMEIAVGLEKSRQRFLWVVRSEASSTPDLDVLLPDGFLDRTRDRGLVVKSWAPQVAVLNHESVGGFVTHCGWNSVLEAVSAGVPMVAWPLYAEQRLNKTVLVEEMNLAIPMEQSEEDGFVSSGEVDKRVSELMDSEEGRALQERSWKMRENALVTWAQGGSSLVAFTELAESWKRG